MRKVWTLLSVVLVASWAQAGDPKPEPTRGPVKVFVTAKSVPTMSKEDKKAREAKAKALGKQLDGLEKQYKKELGKDEKKWPADRTASYRDALYANNLAWTDVNCGDSSDKDRSDSAKDLREKLAGKGPKAWAAGAATREEADLVVEVVGLWGQAGFMVGGKYVCFEVLPGKIGAETLAKVPADWPFMTDNRSVTQLRTAHWVKPEEPFFRFEVTSEERWSDVADMAAVALADFAKENYDLLKPAP